MEHTAFAVCLASLHLPEKADDAECFALLGAESQRLVRRLQQFFQEKLVSSVNCYRTAERIDGSLFCCCLPEGMVMLRCSADPTERTASLDGFLITKETLRTAWQLSRWKLLFVCATGWQRCGRVWISPADIEQIAMSLQATRGFREKLMEASRKMLTSPTPISFAVTDYPLHSIPVHFPGTVQDRYLAEAEERGEIIFSLEQGAALTAQMQREPSVLKSLHLQCGSKKQYQSLRQKHLAAFEDSSALHNELREKLAGYPQDKIWYFSVQVKSDLLYVRALRPAVSEMLSSGTVDFAKLSTETDAFTSGVYRWLEQLKKAEAEAAEASRTGSGETGSSSQKHGGFLRSLFSGKS